jgi:hypothetical protein
MYTWARAYCNGPKLPDLGMDGASVILPEVQVVTIRELPN